MPFPEDMVRIQWEFAYDPANSGADPEIAEFTCWGVVTQEGGGGFPDWQNTVDAIAAKGRDTVAAMATGLFADYYSARRVVAYHYDQTHHNVLHRGEADYTETPINFTGNPAGPPQVALCISLLGFDPALYTAQAARKRGRMYWLTPGQGQLQSANWELSPQGVQTYLEAAQAFFNAMTGTLDIDGEVIGGSTHWRPYVVSPTGSMATKVQNVRVGNVLDTQRRRRNQLPEVYQAGPINV